MIKRSAILLLLLAAGSFSLLVFTSYNSGASFYAPVQKPPVKCSGRCNKKIKVPLHWNIVYPTMFPAES